LLAATERKGVARRRGADRARRRVCGSRFVTLALIAALGRGHLAFAKTTTPPPTATVDTRSLVLWHTQDKKQAEFLTRLVAEFAAAHGLKIRLETGVELGEALLAQADQSLLPDVVLAPSDITGLAEPLRLSEIPPALLTAPITRSLLETVRVRGRVYGVPILQGNHLMLFFNKKLVVSPAATWEALAAATPALAARGIKPVGMDYENAYTFLAFLASFGSWPLVNDRVDLDTPACREALHYYRDLSLRMVVPPDCGFDCATKRFYAGEFAYAVNGDWALREARAALGADLGIAALPAIGKRPMTSLSGTHALVFPAGGLAGPKRAALTAFAEFLQTAAVQQRWAREGGRLPVHEAALKALMSGKSGADADAVQSLAQLRASRPMPNDRRIVLVWPAVRKALRLYVLGVATAAEAAAMMQRLATSGAP
jgi:maltose-binding protein MalE